MAQRRQASWDCRNAQRAIFAAAGSGEGGRGGMMRAGKA
jgi:hypothetical protein